ncbi:nuclear transport factor 2 family protein [Sediminitomix flava]|nr:nuclear transport factor 2 family protein [Sediminitomix flava]
MNKFLIIIFVFISQNLLAQTNTELVAKTIQDYIKGSSYNNADLIVSAFTKDATLFLSAADGFKKYSPQEYASWFENKKEGEFNGRIGEILSIEIEHDIATAKAEILIPARNWRFVDLFLLKKVDDQWKIISKTATKTDIAENGKKVLFIVSNASFYGNTDLSTGNSFSEIVNAYDTFTKAGFNVDFVSPKGGAVPLAYINTSAELIKNYVYNSDFMYALKQTKAPEEINTQDYLAVQYIGGGAAMFQVPDNTAIQEIVMTIYEKQNGIISSVCHGTAGIAHLKTSDGKYLVDGKRVCGYPDEYENPTKSYFKTFPFLITKTIEERGGDFKYSARGKAHVEVDGRLVTGQNYQSSKGVSEKVIELINQNSI